MNTVVIGAGLGGLAVAIRLRARGHSVTIVEANAYPGGKLTEIEVAGYRFDAGPSLFTMPALVSELFDVAQEPMTGRFEAVRKEVTCHYFYPDGTFLRAYADPMRFASETKRVLGVPASRVLDYLQHAARIYQTAGRLFIEHPLTAWETWFSPLSWRALLRLPEMGVLSTLHRANAQRLKDPRLVQYFDRMATYNGSDPYRAPAVLSMIPHLEHNVGTFLPKGGMISITRSLAALAERIGVRFELGCRAQRVELDGQRARAVETTRGRFECDLVVCNADVATAYRTILPRSHAPSSLWSLERSSSAVIFYWGLRRRFPKLELHNVFFSADYAAEFRAIFEQGRIVEDPTVYVAVTSKDVPDDAPEGCENWFVMVNAPANTGQDWDMVIDELRRNVMTKLERCLGQSISDALEVERILDPRSIEERTSSYQGALYGSSSNSKFSAFLRHQNQSSSLDGIYFCGGSVHPGGGIPLCLQSGRIVSNLIGERYGR